MAAQSLPLTISYSLAGTAANDADYGYLYGMVTFAAGSDTAEIVIQPKDDFILETNETAIIPTKIKPR